jgi:hypothetical protein
VISLFRIGGSAFLLFAIIVGTVYFGCASKEFCRSTICRKLAAPSQNTVPLPIWPYSGVDRTPDAAETPPNDLLRMFSLEKFEREEISSRSGAKSLRFSKYVRQHYFLYLPIGADRLVVNFHPDSASVQSVWLLTESIGNL